MNPDEARAWAESVKRDPRMRRIGRALARGLAGGDAQ